MAYNRSYRRERDYLRKNDQFMGQPRDHVFGSSQADDWFYPNEKDQREYARRRHQEEGNLKHQYYSANNRSLGHNRAQHQADQLYSQGSFSMGSQGGLETEGRHAGKGPKGWKRSDDRVREEVCELLQEDMQLDASDIEVEVKDHIVTLKGTVDSRQAKRRAEDCAERAQGVKDVLNALVISNLVDQ